MRELVSQRRPVGPRREKLAAQRVKVDRMIEENAFLDYVHRIKFHNCWYH